MAMDRLRRLALVHGVVGLATCLCLIVLYLGVDPFGAINDVGNGALGLLSAGLAWRCRQAGATAARAFVGIAALGAGITIVGSVLVLTEATGFFLAGLVSSVGFALIGVWLVAVNRRAGPWPRRRRRTGLIAGIVMLLGFVNAPGIAMGLDDMDTAPAWTYLGGLSWAGTYLLFPIWSLRLARSTPGDH
jgi:hypothetical protein